MSVKRRRETSSFLRPGRILTLFMQPLQGVQSVHNFRECLGRALRALYEVVKLGNFVPFLLLLEDILSLGDSVHLLL